MSGNASVSVWRTEGVYEDTDAVATQEENDWVVTSLGPEKLEAEEINLPKLGDRNRRKVGR
jgi:hypothetical protein